MNNLTTDYGGAIYNLSSSPNIVNSIFYENVAASGGAIGNDSASSPLIINSTFNGNFANIGKGAGRDVYNLASSSPVIKIAFFGA